VEAGRGDAEDPPAVLLGEEGAEVRLGDAARADPRVGVAVGEDVEELGTGDMPIISLILA
jgi:hypothetical protein